VVLPDLILIDVHGKGLFLRRDMGFSLRRARVNLGIGQQEEGDEESLKIPEFCSQNRNPSTINAPKILDKMF
jgi:hypothetical protein